MPTRAPPGAGEWSIVYANAPCQRLLGGEERCRGASFWSVFQVGVGLPVGHGCSLGASAWRLGGKAAQKAGGGTPARRGRMGGC
jgi:hypothetical protein